VEADTAGRFAIGGLARTVADLRAQAPGIAESTLFAIADLVGRGELRLAVPVTCTVRVELASVRPADGVAMLDAEGRNIAMTVTQGNLAFGALSVPLHDGRTETFACPDDAAQLVLLEGKRIVLRMPVALRTDQVNVLRP
jgi:hypothetical protein